jgi:hypothetical protein
MGMGNDNHVVVSNKLCGFQGHVDGRIVMMEPVVVVPKFQFLSSHILSQAYQNITVKVRVDHSVRKNKFTVDNPLYIEKKKMCMLSVKIWTCCPISLLVIVGSCTAMIAALFLHHNHKSRFCHPL